MNKIMDKNTQNLMKGLNLLLSLYPKARVRMGFSREELHVRGMEDDLIEPLRHSLSRIPETKKILEDWDWSLGYHEEEYYWEFELIGTINDR